MSDTMTEDVLAGMLTENTGASLLDSGGVYGRNWQRQAGRNTESFRAEPAARMDLRFDYVDVTLSVFHFLRDRLMFDPEMQSWFDKWVAITSDENTPWYADMTAFAEAMRAKYGNGADNFSVNTYNGEDLLSQIIQWESFTGPDGDTYVALQVHGGCDARGGYTEPKMFLVPGFGDDLYRMFDNAKYTLYCDADPESDDKDTLPGMPKRNPYKSAHTVEMGPDIIDRDGSLTTEHTLWPDGMIAKPDGDDSDTWYVPCPYCGGHMSVYAD